MYRTVTVEVKLVMKVIVFYTFGACWQCQMGGEEAVVPRKMAGGW